MTGSSDPTGKATLPVGDLLRLRTLASKIARSGRPDATRPGDLSIPERNAVFTRRDARIAALRAAALTRAAPSIAAEANAQAQIQHAQASLENLNSLLNDRADSVGPSPRTDRVALLRTARRQSAITTAIAHTETSQRSAHDDAAAATQNINVIHLQLLADAETAHRQALMYRDYFDQVLLRHHRYRYDIEARLPSGAPDIPPALLAPLAQRQAEPTRTR